MASIEADITRSVERPESKGVPVKQLIDVNDLNYSLPDWLSVVIQRHHITEHSQNSEAKAGKHIHFTLNSGDLYAVGRSSYLTFKVEAQGGVGNLTFNHSGLDLIRDVIITHSSGVEISRELKVNLYQRMNIKYRKSREWKNAVLSLMGGKPPSENNPYFGADLKVGGPHDIIIPLSMISGLFDKKELLPNYLLSGLRITLILEDPLTCLTDSAGNAANGTATYTITEPRIVLDSVMLSDRIIKEMSELSAKGMELSWESYDLRSATLAQGKYDFNLSSNRAVTQAKRAFMVGRNTDLTTFQGADSLIPAPNLITNSYWRLGALQFPNLQIETKAELYYHALMTFQKHRESYPNITFTQFIGGVADSEALQAVNLERSDFLNFAALPVAGSRALTVHCRYSNAVDFDRSLDLFMIFEKTLTLFLYDKIVITE